MTRTRRVGAGAGRGGSDVEKWIDRNSRAPASPYLRADATYTLLYVCVRALDRRKINWFVRTSPRTHSHDRKSDYADDGPRSKQIKANDVKDTNKNCNNKRIKLILIYLYIYCVQIENNIDRPQFVYRWSARDQLGSPDFHSISWTISV